MIEILTNCNVKGRKFAKGEKISKLDVAIEEKLIKFGYAESTETEAQRKKRIEKEEKDRIKAEEAAKKKAEEEKAKAEEAAKKKAEEEKERLEAEAKAKAEQENNGTEDGE